jgi:hypothetical protein
MRASYTRLFPDQDGTSHFEELEMELLPGFAAPPAEPLHFSDFVRKECALIGGEMPLTQLRAVCW